MNIHLNWATNDFFLYRILKKNKIKTRAKLKRFELESKGGELKNSVVIYGIPIIWVVINKCI